MTDTEILEVVLTNLIQIEERSNTVVQPVIFGGLEICRDVPTNGPLTVLTKNWEGLSVLLKKYDAKEISLYDAIQLLTFVISKSNKTITEEI